MAETAMPLEMPDQAYLRLRQQTLEEAQRAWEDGRRALVEQVQHLEQVVREADAQRQQAEEALYKERAQAQITAAEDLRARVQTLETENRRLHAESQTLWDDRYTRLVAERTQMQRERDIAQAVARVVRTTTPGPSTPPAEDTVAPTASEPAGQTEIIRLLRELVTLVGGNAAPTAPGPSPGDTQVHFPPEPLWPDAFRQPDLTAEDYARALGQDVPEP